MSDLLNKIYDNFYKTVIVDNNIKDVKVKNFGYPDKFIEHGKVEELEEKYKLDEKNIEREIEKIWIEAF